DTPMGKRLVEPTTQLNQTSEPDARREDRIPLNAFLSYSHADKKAKNVFQQNLTVMAQNKLITSWHDGLIEPGMRWREEIEENLAKMDVFIGLLTTAFLASDFIRQVELKVAREKLRKEGRDFLFVLILVDDISLTHLDLAEYQILKPGGKSVCEHKNRKTGFNVAQKELEELFVNRQMAKRPQMREEQLRSSLAAPKEETKGITIITVSGSYVAGNYINKGTSMNDDHSVNIGGNVINSQVGGTLTNCTNMVQQQAPGRRKDLLELLTRDVTKLIETLPVEKKKEASDVAENLETLVKQASKTEPNREWYTLSAKGLLEASKWAKDFTGNIGGTLVNLGKLFWPDFQI
ncbi:MAG: toll/interleukin-1 receptor domain-containing protein, partial [Schlesneria sp.]